LIHPLGFADERLWITPDQTDFLERLLREAVQSEGQNPARDPALATRSR
jgi:hypothetical protein